MPTAGVPVSVWSSEGSGAELAATATRTRPGPAWTDGRGPAPPPGPALDRAVGAILLIVSASLAVAPWLAVSHASLPWWGASAAAVATVFFGSWAVAFGAVLIRPSSLRR
jgi:hypothetical protein